MQQVRAGLKAIYLSGWQIAADNNLAGGMYPDQSIYPANSGPELVKKINRTLSRADEIEVMENGSPQRDWFAPILADADAGFNQNACFNQGVQLNASGGVDYLWEPSFFVNHDTIASPLAFPDDDMTFTVQVTDSNGCIDFDDVRINVFIANAGNDTIICSGDTIQGFIYGDPATTFDWSPACLLYTSDAADE